MLIIHICLLLIFKNKLRQMKAVINTSLIFRLFYFLILLSSIIYFIVKLTGESNKQVLTVTSNVEPATVNSFGFISDSLREFTSDVTRNETLSGILFNFNLGRYTISELVEAAEGIFDVRKIKPGKSYHAYLTNDSTAALQYFVYEKDLVDYVVFKLTDKINVFTGQKKISTIKKIKSSVIKTSLYESLMEDDASPELAIRLSRIFAWQIDFYHLQKGDNFKVIYEELFIDKADTSHKPQFTGIGKIMGAYFHQAGKDYYAIPFAQDSVMQFFDENGNSLRKAFLKTPLEFARISSRFSRNRLHPVLKVHKPHLGVDYAAPVGTPVRTTGDGIVIQTGYSNGNGKYIKIRHNSVYSTMYLHLSKFGKGITNGCKVKQGQVIGNVGSTGLATGPHLDYRFYINGKPVDPLKVELPPSHPVKVELRTEFDSIKNEVLKELNSGSTVKTIAVK